MKLHQRSGGTFAQFTPCCEKKRYVRVEACFCWGPGLRPPFFCIVHSFHSALWAVSTLRPQRSARHRYRCRLGRDDMSDERRWGGKAWGVDNAAAFFNGNLADLGPWALIEFLLPGGPTGFDLDRFPEGLLRGSKRPLVTHIRTPCFGIVEQRTPKQPTVVDRHPA